MRILAFDPGQSIGWALYDTAPSEVVYAGELRDDHYRRLAEKLSHLAYNVVVIENFAGGGRQSRYGQETLRQIGFIQGRLWPVVPVLQANTMRKAFLSIATDYYDTEGHVADALAHALAYVHKHGG